ncbi:MAG: MFS transporter [Alphaproteobacteria bacterium]
MLHKKRLFLTALSGTMVEYFDYALYGFSAAIIASHFFPSQDTTVSLIKTFAVYATGALAKPLGAIIFGRLGDMLGRKVSLRYSMIGIAIPTTAIGLLPGYHDWGWISPAALLILRFTQGIFLAGEYDGVVVYILEHVKKSQRCFANSLIGLSCMVGIHLAATTVATLDVLQLPDWAWRLPFLLGGFMGIATLFFRRHLEETPAFTANNDLDQSGFRDILQDHWPALLANFLICGAAGGVYHFYIVFWPTYASSVLNIFSGSQATFAMSIMTFIMAATSPIAGIIGDRIGAVRLIMLGSISLLAMTLCNIACLILGTLPMWLLAVTTCCIPLFIVPGHVYVMDKLPVRVRYRGMSLGHTLASVTISASTPFFCMLLWQGTNISWVPLCYFAAVISLMPMALTVGARSRKKASSYHPS